MKTAVRIAGFLLLAGVMGSSSMLLAESTVKNSGKEVIAYVFVNDRLIAPGEVSARKLTRVNYAFANIKDGVIVEGFSHDRENFQILNGLKAQNPDLKVMVSVGGWGWSGGFSDAVASAQSRKKFVDSAVQFVLDHNLDGLDIDWEYPGQPGAGNKFRPEDKQNYTLMLKELRTRFNIEGKKQGKHWYTSVATGANERWMQNTEMKKVQLYVDSINLMCYDYYGSGPHSTTGHHAPLYTNPADPKLVSADTTVKLNLAAGVQARKMVLGVPFYGKTWGQVEATNHGLFQPGEKTTVKADYKSITDKLIPGGYVRYWDSKASAPYLYDPGSKTWVSYDDPESIALKAKYVLSHKLGGMMFWDYQNDPDEHLLDAVDLGLGIKVAPAVAKAVGQ
jgi:chitinase